MIEIKNIVIIEITVLNNYIDLNVQYYKKNKNKIKLSSYKHSKSKHYSK